MTETVFDLLRDVTQTVELGLEKAFHFAFPTSQKDFVLMDLPNDAVSTAKLTFADQFGRAMSPEVGASVATSDPSIATVAISADNASIVITPVALSGDFTVTYTSALGKAFSASFTLAAVDPIVGIDLTSFAYTAK